METKTEPTTGSLNLRWLALELIVGTFIFAAFATGLKGTSAGTSVAITVTLVFLVGSEILRQSGFAAYLVTMRQRFSDLTQRVELLTQSQHDLQDVVLQRSEDMDRWQASLDAISRTVANLNAILEFPISGHAKAPSGAVRTAVVVDLVQQEAQRMFRQVLKSDVVVSLKMFDPERPEHLKSYYTEDVLESTSGKRLKDFDLTLDNSVAGFVFQSSLPLIISDVREETRLSLKTIDTLKKLRVGSCVAWPLQAQDEYVAVLEIDAESPNLFRDDDTTRKVVHATAVVCELAFAIGMREDVLGRGHDFVGEQIDLQERTQQDDLE